MHHHAVIGPLPRKSLCCLGGPGSPQNIQQLISWVKTTSFICPLNFQKVVFCCGSRVFIVCFLSFLICFDFAPLPRKVVAALRGPGGSPRSLSFKFCVLPEFALNIHWISAWSSHLQGLLLRGFQKCHLSDILKESVHSNFQSFCSSTLLIFNFTCKSRLCLYI